MKLNIFLLKNCTVLDTWQDIKIIKQTNQNNPRDFPGGPVVKSPPSKAEDMGSIPGQGTEIPCTPGHLSTHTSTKTQHSQKQTNKNNKKPTTG